MLMLILVTVFGASPSITVAVTVDAGNVCVTVCSALLANAVTVTVEAGRVLILSLVWVCVTTRVCVTVFA